LLRAAGRPILAGAEPLDLFPEIVLVEDPPDVRALWTSRVGCGGSLAPGLGVGRPAAETAHRSDGGKSVHALRKTPQTAENLRLDRRVGGPGSLHVGGDLLHEVFLALESPFLAEPLPELQAQPLAV
jgi:hypothetical protein